MLGAQRPHTQFLARSAEYQVSFYIRDRDNIMPSIRSCGFCLSCVDTQTKPSTDDRKAYGLTNLQSELTLLPLVVTFPVGKRVADWRIYLKKKKSRSISSRRTVYIICWLACICNHILLCNKQSALGQLFSPIV